MITAFLSDIHSNLLAMEAVLKDARNLRAKQIVCLGDMVGYGPRPMECVNRMMTEARLTVMGNHEVFVAFSEFDLRGLREDVADGIVLARNCLDESQLGLLRQLPLTARIDDVCIVHSSLEEPAAFPYVHTARDAFAHFQNQPTRLAFIGHSHVPEAWFSDGEKAFRAASRRGVLPLESSVKYLVNVGSVGQPRDRDPRACYVLFDDETDTVCWRRVTYNISGTVSAMKTLGMPQFSSSRLMFGN